MSSNMESNMASSGAQSLEADEIDLKELFQIVRRRIWLIAGLTLVAILGAAILTLTMTPKYTARTQIQIEDRETSVVDIDSVMEGLNIGSSTVETEVKVLSSTTIAESVVDRLNLVGDTEFNPLLKKRLSSVENDGASLAGLKQEAALILSDLVDGIKAWLPWLEVDDLRVLEGSTEYEKIKVIERFQESVSVSGIGKSLILQVAVESESPEKAAKIANTTAQAYLDDQRERKFAATRDANSWLAERVTELKEQVVASEGAVESYKQRSQIVHASGTSINESQLSDLSAQIIQARAQLAENRARYENVQGLIEQGLDTGTIAEAVGSSTISELRRQQAQVVRRKAELEGPYGELHPEMIKVNRELADLNAQIQDELSRIVSSLRNELQVKQERVRSLEVDYAKLEKQYKVNSNAMVKLRELEREAEANRRLYEEFLGRFKETTESESLTEEDARILAAARTPTEPSSPNLLLNLALGGILGGGLGLAITFVLQMFENGFRSASEVEAYMGASVLASIPMPGKRLPVPGSTDPIAYFKSKPHSAFAESFGSLRAAITLSDIDNPPKVIMFTSANPGEGKSTACVCFAQSLAMAGMTVAIVDCDFRRPKIATLLGSGKKSKPTDYLGYLTEGGALDTFVTPIDERTDAYLLRRPPSNPQAIISSTAFSNFLAELKQKYDAVILDTAPVLPVADSRLMASKVDSIVFMVEWAETHRESAMGGYKELQRAGGRVAGVAMNKVDFNFQQKYGYSDGYYHREYGSYLKN